MNVPAVKKPRAGLWVSKLRRWLGLHPAPQCRPDLAALHKQFEEEREETDTLMGIAKPKRKD